MKPFTDKFLQSLKPKNRQYYVREGRGFAVRVLPSGVKTFLYIYTFKGTRRQLNLGNYPATKFAEAHQKYRDAVAVLVAGEDPQAAVPEQVYSPPEPVEKTVADLKMEYIKDITIRLDPRSVKHKDQNLEKYLIPAWGNRPVKSIGRPEAIKLIRGVATTKPGAARNVTLAARAMYEFALDLEYVDINPFRKISRAVPQAAANSVDRVLNHDEIRTIWNELTHGYGSSDVRRILKLILLLGQRPGEVAQMRHEDIIGDWWTIPKEEIKIGKNPNIDEKKKFDQWVFLPPLAKELIGDGVGHVFTPRGTPITENALSGHVRRDVVMKDGRMRKKRCYGLSTWTPHDLRRTMSTQLAEELDADHRHIDAILGHIIPGILGVYVRTKYAKKKQELGLAWEKKLLEILSQQSPAVHEVKSCSEYKRILADKEIRVIWQQLSMLQSKHAGRAIQFILVTGQPVGICASCHQDQVTSETTGTWWQTIGSNKIYLTPTARRLIGDSDGYAFAPRGAKHINIATLSYHILTHDCFGLPKWTPADLRYTVAVRIRDLGGPPEIIDALNQGAPTNYWELRHWLERWEQSLLSIIA